MDLLNQGKFANSGKSGLLSVTLVNEDGEWCLGGVYGEKTPKNLKPKEQSHWELERTIGEEDQHCPCDGHPAPNNCETCRGACSCHWVDQDAEWFTRDWSDCGTDMIEAKVAREVLMLSSIEDAVCLKVRLYGRMWWRRYGGDWGDEYDGGFTVEGCEVLK